ncbi:MAG: type II toxin-antitoxin system RelE/ParE family toxin [Candidatus Micrarchaeota archaeon]|nr:type II toxin-antitoxin system RelE/ParE family toxin [Candidatus Micrarchaeota archaeon]
MSYAVELSETAKGNLRHIEQQSAKRITDKIERIRNNPFDYVKRLRGVPFYSLRVGDYRVIMDIRKGIMLIFVVRIGHRKEVYEEL